MTDKKKRNQAIRKNRKYRQKVQSAKAVERMWAEDGMVKVQATDGSIVIKTVRQAAEEAVSLNAMFGQNLHAIPKELHDEAKRIHGFITQIVQCCREAKSQTEQGQKGAVLINNMFSGLTPDGKKLEKGNDEDEKIQKLMLLYPGLDEQDIRVILRDKGIKDLEKQELMAQMSNQFLSEKYGIDKMG
jgi:hypothetical protein